MFQHTAARRRLLNICLSWQCLRIVSTHSRAEAAAHNGMIDTQSARVSTHSRAEAAATAPACKAAVLTVSTHSRAEAAAKREEKILPVEVVFQHTAARRRLLAIRHKRINSSMSFNTQPRGGGCWLEIFRELSCLRGFNTQPRGGGCNNIGANQCG